MTGGRVLAGGVAALVAAALAWLATGVAAAAAPAVTVGFAGAYRGGAWTPVVVSGGTAGPLRAGAMVHVWAPDPDGQFVRSPPARVADRPDGAVTATARVRIGRPAGRLRLECRGGDGAGEEPVFVEVDLPPALPATDRVVLLVGDLPAVETATQRAWQIAARTAPTTGTGPPAGETATAGPRAWVVRTDGGGDVSGTDARDYDMVDTVVVCGRALPRTEAAVLDAIDTWVRRGGRLLVIAGESAASIAPASRAGAWLPGRVSRLTSLRGGQGIEAWLRGGPLPDRAAAIRVPIFSDPQRLPGVSERIDDDAAAGISLVVRRAHGLGTITWLGLDIDAEPFRDWSGTPGVLAKALGDRPATADAPGDVRGMADLAGQLRVALERSAPGADHPPAAPLPFEVAIGLGLLYVLFLYPLDWWLVSRGVGRPGIGWLSLPAIVAGFTLLAWWIATSRSAPPGGTRFAAAAVDIDALTGMVRGRSWSGIQTAENGVFDVSIAADPGLCTGPADRAVSWLADAGTGLGGIDAATAHPALAAADYCYGDSLATLEQVPIAANATRLFEAEWFGTRAEPTVTATLEEVAADGTLRGTLAHHLPFPLDECQLLHGNWLYDVGRLPPGDLHDLAIGRGPRSLQAALTRRQAAAEREQVPPWDPAGTDVERILEVAGLHAAAGGTGYTGIGPGRLAPLDLSDVAGLDRAVLIGRAAAAATVWDYSSGRVPARGRYRIVIPVVRAGSASRSSASPVPAP